MIKHGAENCRTFGMDKYLYTKKKRTTSLITRKSNLTVSAQKKYYNRKKKQNKSVKKLSLKNKILKNV